MNEFDLKARKIAIWVIFIMIGIWIALSIFSFTNDEERGRTYTTETFFEGESGLIGKQVFQSYNCMDCHTIVGNGAYFAPDLTKSYTQSGPAWLKAYLASPATYPTEAVVNVNLQQLYKDGEIDISDIDAYFEKYPAAQERVDERGGVDALMPNLRFTSQEISALIAYLKYTSQVNTGGWPPEVIAKESVIEDMKRRMEARSGLRTTQASLGFVPSEENSGISSPVDIGQQIAEELGCMACHTTDGTIQIGPSFKGIYGKEEVMEGGTKVKIDEEYLRRSILDPDADIVEGFSAGLMPAYEGLISEEDIENIIEFIKAQK